MILKIENGKWLSSKKDAYMHFYVFIVCLYLYLMCLAFLVVFLWSRHMHANILQMLIVRRRHDVMY